MHEGGGQNRDERKKQVLCSEAERAREAHSEIRRAVSMKIAIKESNIAAMRKRLKTVSQKRGVDKTKSF